MPYAKCTSCGEAGRAGLFTVMRGNVPPSVKHVEAFGKRLGNLCRITGRHSVLLCWDCFADMDRSGR